ncbi:cytochrome c-type biogenesis protein CcmH [Janthinobacterium sp. 551a]|uniref:cytochrome c-type biogenesis protein n=1 Tax=unclassified Janthinobacterium TaxID=2610881 RepID=UPI0034A43068
MLWSKGLIVLCLFFAINTATGTTLTESAAAKYRTHELSKNLRCLNCANQSIAESEAPSAIAIRYRVEKMASEGASDDEIVAYLVHRYGPEISYSPELDRKTFFLWLLPCLCIMFGIAMLWRQEQKTYS